MHYTQAMLFQLYRLVGSIDVLGNPVSLFNTVSGGVLSLFYEPYQGLVMHGNHRELGMGLARGASTAVKSIVFGLSDSASKMTGSISQGLASATMDREFQARRRMTKFRNKPRHALLGLTAAGQSFFTSVTSGVEGLALRPLEGAEQNGAAGFVAGIGKALVGLATKPAVGLFDAASNITEGVRNTTAIFEKNEIDRVRLPRFIASDEIVRPYSDREALGQTWLKNVDEGRLMRDHYVAHVDVGNAHPHSHIPHLHKDGQVDMAKEYQRLHMSQGDNVILLTVSRILFIRTVRMKVAWEVLLSDLSSISLENEGIALILRGNIAGPFLPLRDVGSRNWLFKQISRVVQSYNAAHQQ